MDMTRDEEVGHASTTGRRADWGCLMITLAEVEKLGAIHAVEPMVLSVYLNVPPHLPEPVSLSGRVAELITSAEGRAGKPGHLWEQDRSWVLEKAAAAGPDWPGRTVAIFACADVGLLEVLPLPCYLPERAVLGVRPHIRPLLAALQEDGAAAEEILAAPPGGLAAVGLPACLAAVNACAVATLVVPGDVLVPGYECGRCGALSMTADSCPDWGTAPLPVPDVIEEMVARTLEDGGQVSVAGDGPSRVAARLRFPVTP